MHYRGCYSIVTITFFNEGASQSRSRRGGDVDYAQLVKLYGGAPREDACRYSPVECVGAIK